MRANRSILHQMSVVAGVGLLAAASAHLSACSSDTKGPQGQSTEDGTGSVGMNLSLPGGEVVNSVSWTITGPNGFTKSSTFSVQGSTAISFTVGGLPSGSGYTVSISATTADATVTCLGSATFSVTAGMTSIVKVLVQCNAPGMDSGTANITGQTFLCANAGGVSASPSEAAVGSPMALTATATAPNPGGITYAWSAPSGSFAAPTSASTTFTCSQPGPVTLTLTVGDGPVPAGGTCNPATSTSTITVTCDGAGDAGSDATVGSDASGASACNLGANGAIKHVIYVQFDNTHLNRDVPNVASDLEQMPHLLNFIRGNGTMMANDHTILISHTGGGILSTLTGVYPDRHGQTVSNSFVRTSSTGAFSFPSTFQYWTDTVSASGTPTVPNLVQPDGSQMPAPWVTYTRAGCNFGAVGIADMELENVSTGATGDMTTVFGANSPQWNEAKANSSKAVTDFEGIAVHCAQGSSVCTNGEADKLPGEPGGYVGFNGLFGAQQVDPVLTGQDASVALTDLLGNPITDVNGNPGFPGFNGMEPAVALSYVASMQEHGVPITYTYLSDAHDSHGTDGSGQAAFGPGQAGYTAQLQAYDQAFANFFTRLAADGIDQSNTLFVFTVDEGDHFVGVAPQPSTCDGTAGNACNYPAPAGQSSGIGEVNVNIDTLFTTEQPTFSTNFVMGNDTNPGAPYDFTVHGDDAPPFYLSRVSAAAGTTGPLAQTDPIARQFERAAGAFTILNPYTGNTDNLLFKMADQTGMAAVHMITTGDPARNATFAYFADADYFITDFPSSTCADCIESSFAWNHGDDQSVIGQTWAGFVGPGVKNEANQGDQTIWTDHTDVRPTMLSVLGLRDSYMSDGRVITQALNATDYSGAVAANTSTLESLGDAYKQINSPFDVFPQCALTVSTFALQADDATYASLESQIASMTSQRDTLATAIKTALDGAEFGGTPIATSQASTWIGQAAALVASCNTVASSLGTVDAGSPAVDSGSSSTVDSGSSPTVDSGSTTGPTGGNLAVYRVGDGVQTLANTGNSVFIDEFTPAGALVTSIALPTADNGASHAVIASGTATSEGLLTLSTNGKYLIATGYDLALPQTTSIVSSSAPRTVARIDALGNIDSSTALTDWAQGNNPRSATSTDGTSLWVTGAAGGVRFTTLGSTTSTQISAGTLVNLRQTDIFGGQLFITTASGSAVRVGTVGTGTPTTAGQAIVGIPGFATSSGSPYGFFFTDLTGDGSIDTLYVADDTAGTPGGVTKYSLVGGSWTASGTAGNSADSYRGITGITSGGVVTLYSTRKGGSSTAGGGELVSIVDASGFDGALTATPALLAEAPSGTSFRGVAFAPQQ
jgi:hypothetical protein